MSYKLPAGLRAVQNALLAIGGGVAFALCFGRDTVPWLGWVAFAPLVILLFHRRALFWGWIYGLVYWLVSVFWIASTIHLYGGLPRWLAAVALVLMALILSLDQLLFTLFGRWIVRAGGWLPYLALPALWVTLEWARGFFVGGFPWNLAAYAWVDLPGALPLASWVGAFGVSFLLVYANVGLALAWRRRRVEAAALAFLVPALLLTLAGRFSRDDGTAAIGAESNGRPSHQVLVLQPNTPIVTTRDEAWQSYGRLIEMSRSECSALGAGERALLVWPESAAWPFSYPRYPHVQRDVAELGELGCDVLLGSATESGDRYYNSSLLVHDDRVLGVYSKRQLVPWGEYVPFADLLPFMNRVARAAGDFAPGTDLGLLPWEGERIGMAICYEVVFPGAVAEQVRAGATILATITNDAWYGDTAAPWQHFRAARFRAAENRRPLVRAALSGVSGMIDARGEVGQLLGVGERGVLRGRIRGATGLTPFARAPWLVPLASTLLAVFAVAFAIVEGRAGGGNQPASRPDKQTADGRSTRKGKTP
jgi:apolipoprotein N-acyltransferase